MQQVLVKLWAYFSQIKTQAVLSLIPKTRPINVFLLTSVKHQQQKTSDRMNGKKAWSFVTE